MSEIGPGPEGEPVKLGDILPIIEEAIRTGEMPADEHRVREDVVLENAEAYKEAVAAEGQPPALEDEESRKHRVEAEQALTEARVARDHWLDTVIASDPLMARFVDVVSNPGINAATLRRAVQRVTSSFQEAGEPCPYTPDDFADIVKKVRAQYH